MKKKGILLVAVVLLGAASFAQAEEGTLSGTIDVTYLSSYIWRGLDWYDDDHSAMQIGTDLNLFDTGFGFKVLGTRATGSGDGILGIPNENLERWEWTLYYANSIDDTDYTVGWTYYNLPDNPQEFADMQEAFASLSWPDLCPAGVVPSYTVLRMWPSSSKSGLNTALGALGRGSAGGWLHIPGLSYDLTVEGFLPETPEQVLHLSAAAVYNDGVFGADHDWSHAVFGVSTDFDLGNNLSLTPGVYHQSSWDDSVNTQDETWAGVSLKYKF